MYTFKSRVRYSEINSERELTLPSLLDYLQDCCTFQSEALGVGLDYLAEKQLGWVLLSWEIEIVRYPKMGEEISVHTWPYNFKGFYGYRNFLVESDRGGTIARANSIWAFMDMGRMRPTRITDAMLQAYDFDEPLTGEWGDRKIEPPANGQKKEHVQVARSHIDTNHHMNNGKYVLVAEEYLPEDFLVGRLRVEYRKAARVGDILCPEVTVEQDAVTVVLAEESGSVWAVVQFLRRQQ